MAMPTIVRVDTSAGTCDVSYQFQILNFLGSMRHGPWFQLAATS
jgi:hypothetical protein